MEAHHVTTRGAGGGDEQLAPLCSLAHQLIHDGCGFNVDLAKIAADLWKASPHRQKYEMANSNGSEGPRGAAPESITIDSPKVKS